jgi:site-specific recombinase XerD
MRAKITDRFIKESVFGGIALPDNQFPPAIDLEIRDTALTGFILIVRKTSILTFCLRYRNENGHARKFTIGRYGDLTTTKARQIAQRKLGEIRTGVDIQAQRTNSRRDAERAKSRSLRGFIDHQYRDWVLTERKSGAATLARIEGKFVDWYDRPLDQINTWLVTNWRSKRIRAGAHKATVNRDISALKALMSKAIEWDVIDEHPLRDLKPLREDKTGKTRFLSKSEESRLRNALDTRQNRQRAQRRAYRQWQLERGRDLLPSLDQSAFTDHIKPIVIIALNTGLRRGEIFNLQLGDIDLTHRLLTVRGEEAKSGHTRTIPLNSEALRAVETWLEESDSTDSTYVFPSPKTGRGLVTIKTAWRDLLKLANLKDFRFHDLRHTFASNLAMKGADLYSIKELLGHADVTTTQRYAHLAPEHRSKVVELLVAT